MCHILTWHWADGAGGKKREDIYEAFESIYPVLQEFRKGEGAPTDASAQAGPSAAPQRALPVRSLASLQLQLSMARTWCSEASRFSAKLCMISVLRRSHLTVQAQVAWYFGKCECAVAVPCRQHQGP